MKKTYVIILGLLVIQGCNSNTENITTNDLSQVYNSSANKSLDNPDFIKKLTSPAKYRVANKTTNKSICGKNDLQQINSYDGLAGQPVEFVASHKSAVGAMEHGSKDTDYKFCSGTLISENLFITASHCLDELTVSSQYVAFNYERAKNSTELLKQSHFKITQIVEDHTENLDYAILKLEGNPGKEFGWTKVKDTIPELNSKLTIIQHPSDEPKQVAVGNMAGIKGNYMLYSDLDTKPGASGSGILDESGSLVGVHTTGGCTISAGTTNSGVRLSEIAKVSNTIKQLIARK